MKLGNIFKAIVDVATLPVEVAKDFATLGGAMTGQEESYTSQKVEKIAEELNDQ